jgi:hypothetical protein
LSRIESPADEKETKLLRQQQDPRVTHIRKRLFPIAVLLAATIVPAGHGDAQTRFTIVPSISLAHVYDDNIFADVEGSAGQMLQIRPSVEGNFESPRLAFLSVYSQDMLKSNHGDLNTLDARRHAFFDTKFRSTPAVTVGIQGRYDRSETPGEIELDTGILGPRQTAQRFQIAPNFARRMGPRSVLTGGYDFTHETEVDTPSGRMHQARIALSREWTSRTSIVGSYLARLFRDDFGDQMSHAVLAGISREVAPGATFSFYAGPRVTSYRSGIKPEVSTTLARTTNRTSMAIDYWHGETIILGIPGPVAVDSGTARMTWMFGPKLEFGTHAGITDVDTIDFREARVYRTTLIGSWTPRGMYTVAASYGLDYQQGDIRRRLDEDVLRHVFRVSLTVAPRLIRSDLPPEEAARVKGVGR